MNKNKTIEIKKILKKMETITKENPICMEYGSDARETWPNRWSKLEKYLLKFLDK